MSRSLDSTRAPYAVLAATFVALLLVCLSGFTQAASPASVAPDIPLAPEIASGNFLVNLSEASGEEAAPIPGRVWQKSIPDCDRVIGSSYCHNDPINKYDVLGLYDEEADAALTAINEEIAILDKVIEVHKRAKTRHWITLNEEMAAGTEFIGGPGDRKHDDMQAQLSGYEDQRYELSERRGELIQLRGQTTTEKVVWNGLAAIKGGIQLTGVEALMAKDFEETSVMGIINLANMASGLEDSQPLADGFAEDLKTTEGKVRTAGLPLLILRGKLPRVSKITPASFFKNTRLEVQALQKQGLSRSEAFSQIRSFNAGNADGFAFHFTSPRGAAGILNDGAVNSGFGIAGRGVYAGTTPTPSALLQYGPTPGWALTPTKPVRIPLRVVPELNPVQPALPFKTYIFRVDRAPLKP